MKLLAPITDRLDVVSDWFGFGDPYELDRSHYNHTHIAKPDRDFSESVLRHTHRVLIAITISATIVVIVSQICLAITYRTQPPIGTYYVDRDDETAR